MPEPQTAPMMPQDVTDVEMAFPATVSHLMPPLDVLDEYRRTREGRDGKWVEFQRAWFFYGLESYEIKWRDGIDGEKAMRHLACIQGSFEPKHEHKEAAVAYLLSLWATDVKWKTNDRSDASSHTAGRTP